MTREDAIKHLDNMKWLKGYSNTTVDGKPLENVIDDIITLLKAQEPVRCAECKHCFDADRGTPYDGDEEWYCKRWERYVSAYAVDPYRFYCAAGEKREVRVKDQVCGGDGYGAE